jgi:antirestriction protein ArdC
VKRDLYAEVSTRIIAELEAGAAPWVKPWSAKAGTNTPCNAVTSRPYSGCNVILLWLARDRGWPTPRFLTFKQAIEAGGNVRKGEHGTKVYFVKQLQIKDGDSEDTRALQAYLGHRNIQHTVRYTELAPTRFKDFWRE